MQKARKFYYTCFIITYALNNQIIKSFSIVEMQLNNIKNNRPATAMGKQVLSHTRSAPSFSMSGRTKFGGFI